MNFFKNLKRAYHYIHKYGLVNFIKKFIIIIFLQLFPIKLSELSYMDNILNNENGEKKDSEYLLTSPLIFFEPVSYKRVNLIVDRLYKSDLLTTTIQFSILLSNNMQSKLRIITQFEFAKKSIISTVIQQKNISSPNIDFLYAQPGNPQISIPFGSDEFLIFNSWKDVKRYSYIIDESRIIYIMDEKERNELRSNGSDFYDYYLNNNSSFLIILTESEIMDEFLLKLDPIYQKNILVFENKQNNIEMNKIILKVIKHIDKSKRIDAI